jgi:D-alanyl-lipoteichoic acid acyltransferase DltB (MBOAT superfamily)
MTVAGLWHGANWTFVVFGAMHGVILGVERFLFPVKSKPGDAAQPPRSESFSSVWVQRILTFNLFCLTLIFFRATSLSSALRFLGGLFNFTWRSEYASAFFMLCIFSVPLFSVDLMLEAGKQEYLFANRAYAVRTAVALAALVVLTFFSGNGLNAFVYFQF